MSVNKSELNIVRIGSHISYSSLKEIGNRLLGSFQGIIQEVQLRHHDSPILDSIDAQLLTKILHVEVGGHTLGITDADLITDDADEFYSTIIGGKNPQNDVAVVSTRKLSPVEIHSQKEYDLLINRTLKVSLHEVGHNLGLIDHASFKTASGGALCPMSKGEYNKFGYWGYVRAVIDERGFRFCEECTDFLKKVYRIGRKITKIMADGITVKVPGTVP